MIEPSGHVKVMDFGIAKLEAGANLTSTGSLMGTPNYMSPEQARGEKVDARSDLFSLGCVLYECLTGTRPFQSQSVGAILVKVLTEAPPPVDFEAAGLPPEVGPVLLRATAKEPAARYPSGAAMIDALRALASPAPSVPAAPPTVVSAAAPPRRRVPRLAAAAGVALLVAALAWVGSALRPPRPLPGRRLVAEEDIGFLGRLVGREPRLLVTLPAGTVLHLALASPLSSESTVTGAAIAAETARPLRIEGVEVVPEGSRVVGRVTHAASAEQAGGRGELTLELDPVQPADGGRFDVHTKPLGLRAPAAPRKKDNAFIESLSDLSAAVGDLIGDDGRGRRHCRGRHGGDHGGDDEPGAGGGARRRGPAVSRAPRARHRGMPRIIREAARPSERMIRLDRARTRSRALAGNLSPGKAGGIPL